MSSLVSPSLVDWASFTTAQREALSGLALGDRGAALRRASGRTAGSLERRGMIERRPAGPGVVPGWRLTVEGQSTVIARGWVGDLVVRSDDVVEGTPTAHTLAAATDESSTSVLLMSTPSTPYALTPVVLDDGCDAAEAAFRIESRAAQLAHVAHADHVRHVRRVAERLADPRDRALAWLHDVVEDSAVDLDGLRALGFPADLVAEVDAITHRPGEPRGLYYARIRRAGDRVVRVKLADVDDNMDPSRRAGLDAADVIRLERKYTAARRMLLGLPLEAGE